MKVFEVAFDHKRYQMVGTMPGLVEKHRPTHADARLLENWEPLTGAVDNPTKRRGDFLWCGLEYLVCKREITQALAACLRDQVQVLPVEMQDDTAPYDLWNITNYVDALDMQRTQFKPPPFRSLPQAWVFKPECFDRPALFRTPHVPATPLVVTGFDARSEEDFYVQYRALKLKGLKLDLLWESG